MSTAQVSQALSGDKLYQERARKTVPLLVRQARAGMPIYYSYLAEELGMPNPRNLNYVLGSVGKSMASLSNVWSEKVPPLQCLVVNKGTGLPGDGIGWFLLDKEGFAELPLRQRRAIVDAELQHIYAYSRWGEVLQALSLKPVQTDFSPILESAAHYVGGGGEGARHLALKRYVAANPTAIGLSARTPFGETELPLPSGDCLDVSFRHKGVWIAVEVKSAISPQADIVRGLFQCVKYRAVLEAVQLAEDRPQNARAILVLETQFPERLVALRNLLGVEIVEKVQIPDD